jgi:GT2 family glycosyltransferase
MIVFGTLVADDGKFASFANKGLELVREPDSRVLTDRSATSMAQGYNAILRGLRDAHDLEALVLLHEDTEITDPEFCAKVRRALADPTVGLIGVVGATNVTRLAYWHGELQGRVSESRGTITGAKLDQDVDAVDGLLMVLSPWAVRHLGFDETHFPAFHGYDIDFSFAVRAAGARVVTQDIAVHHHTKGGYGNTLAYVRASRAFRRKWLPGLPAAVRRRAACQDGLLLLGAALHSVGLWRGRFSTINTG